MSRYKNVTHLLEEWSHGDLDAFESLIPLVVDEVRDIARRHLAHEAPGHSMQATDLVHEVYLRLLNRRSVQWKNRRHFFGAMADMMRRILVDHARRKLASKRGGGIPKISMEELGFPVADHRPEQLVALDDALADLEKVDPRQHQIILLRFFMGLTEKEIGEVLGLSATTVGREWRLSRLWLRQALEPAPPEALLKRA